MRLRTAILGLAAVILAMPSAAEEILVFKSGQTLPIVSHEIKDGMVHVDLGDNGFLAFPLAAIESIETADRVALKPSYGTASNRRTPTTAGSYPATTRVRPEREPIPMDNSKASPVEIDPRTGMASYRPMANSEAKNKRYFSVTGNMRVLNENPVVQGNGETTFGGTTPLGERHVIGGLTPRRTNAPRSPNVPRPVGIRMKSSVGGAAPSSSESSDPNR